jgi:Ni/Fe-hydrogenase b-type cytochrome subunit
MKRHLVRQHIYGPVQRVLHWWIALATTCLIASGLLGSSLEAGSQRAFVWDVHIVFGKVLAVAFVGRLLWGFIGPEHALFSGLIHPKAWLASLKTRQIGSADAAFGHHPQASLSYLGFYGLTIVMISSGLVLAGSLHGRGPFGDKLLDDFTNADAIRFVHTYVWWAIGFFIVTHVAALVLHEWRDRIPMAQSMISGFQYRTADKQGESSETT